MQAITFRCPPTPKMNVKWIRATAWLHQAWRFGRKVMEVLDLGLELRSGGLPSWRFDTSGEKDRALHSAGSNGRTYSNWPNPVNGRSMWRWRPILRDQRLSKRACPC